MMNGVNRALSGGFDRRNTNIDRVDSITETHRKVPVRGASGRGGARLGITHHAALCTSRGNVKPTISWRFHKVSRTIVHDDACSRSRWKSKRTARRINFCARIRKRRICNPQGFFLLIRRPMICATSDPTIRINRFARRTANSKM